MRSWARLSVLIIAGAAAIACSPQSERGDYSGWSAYGGGPEQIKYSSLDQITTANVAKLGVAWTYDTQENPTFGTMHSTPLLRDGVLYLAGPEGGIHAVDPATGKRHWTFKYKFDEDTNTYFRGAPRGLMYWTDGKDARVYGLAGQYVFSVDAKTGKLDESFGKKGHIDLHEGLGRDPGVMDAELGSPGAVYKNLLILGSRMGEQLPTAPGHIRAYDARTGEQKWIFHTIPHPGEFGYETWPKDAWTYSGAANSWSGASLDEKRGLVFLATGSAASDFYGADRHGDNLFANSVLALNAETGERVWHQQILRHDLWDRDLPTPPVLVTIERNGKKIDAVVQTTKSAHVWVFDRETGEPLFPIEEVEAPPSDLPGELAAKSQRVPTLPAPFVRQTFTEADLTDRTPAANAAARKIFQSLDPHHPFGPPTLRGRVLFPGFDGGGEWGGGAFDPETGYFYVNANEVPWILRAIENKELTASARASDVFASFCAACHGADRAGTGDFPSLINIAQKRSTEDVAALIANGAGRMPGFSGALEPEAIKTLAAYVVEGKNGPVSSDSIAPQPFDNRFRNDGWPKFVDPDGYPASKPPWGSITAINLQTGEHVWKRPLGEYPELVAQGMANTGSENYGGPVVTAGGLVFIAATLKDNKIRALDKMTGEELWSYTLPAAGVATPAVYQAGGRQFVVIAAGGARAEGHPRGSTYIAFALPPQ